MDLMKLIATYTDCMPDLPGMFEASWGFERSISNTTLRDIRDPVSHLPHFPLARFYLRPPAIWV